MKIFNIFSSKERQQKIVKLKKEKKSGFTSDDFLGIDSSFTYFANSQNYILPKIIAVNYYTKCSPLYNAVDMIASEIASLTPKIWDKDKEEWVEDHPLLDLLEKPNGDLTWWEFVYTLVSFYIITGDTYMLATGAPMQPPKEIFTYPATGVVVLPDKDGYAGKLLTTLHYQTDTFNREEVDLRFRYFNSQKTNEIWHIKYFNPTVIQGNLYGMSPLNPIFYEINQQQSANQHNLSLLERGARTGGIVTIDPPIDDDEFVKLQQQIDKIHSGSKNAGRIMLLNGMGTFTPDSINNKDMDYIELKKEVTNAIYRTLKIPLALVNTESMTLDNMSNSILLFYDKAVLPLANRIFSELTNFLIPRYKGSENYILTYDEGDLGALEPRRNNQLQVLKNLGIFTVNQLRAFVGAEPLDGGNVVYSLSTQIPAATDPNDESIQANYEDLPDLDDVGGNDEKMGSKKPKNNRAKFTEILKAKVNPDGTLMFTDEEINKIADKHGLQ